MTRRAAVRRRRRAPVVAVAAVALVAAGGWWVLHQAADVPVRQRCAATLDGTDWYLSPVQAENAALVAGAAVRRAMPPRAATIALATALQESKLVNIDYGDRDSLGLFQQRPSTGWGTPDQILNASHAARLFYGGPSNPNKGKTRGLLDIPGWQSMSLTQAAQAVQISAYPNAYAKWETSATSWLAQLG